MFIPILSLFLTYLVLRLLLLHATCLCTPPGTFVLGGDSKGKKRPLLNGNFTFLAGFLDQSWWPDGQYTAPTDDALAYDVLAVPMFGLNMIRLHQKVRVVCLLTLCCLLFT